MQAVLLKITVCLMKVFLNKAEIILINYAHAFLVLIGLMQVNKIQFLSNMANVLSILFIPVFARSLGASYFEVGLIVSVYSAATLISSFIFGRFADYYHPRTVLPGGFGFSVTAFILQVFASNPATLMLARAFTGFTVGICPGVLPTCIAEKRVWKSSFLLALWTGWRASC